MKIQNRKLINQVLIFNNKSIQFNEEGISEELNDNEGEILLSLPFYEKVELGKKENKKSDEVINKDEKVEEDYESKSVTELKKILTDKGIEFNDRAKKADLLKLLA